MEPLRASLCAELADVRPNDGNIPMYSTVYGRTIEGTSLDGVYWYENLRSPVRLDLAVQAALADGYSRFVECSVHPVLLGVLDGVDAHPPGDGAGDTAPELSRRARHGHGGRRDVRDR